MSDWPIRSLRALADVELGRQRSPQHEEGPHMVPYLRAANVSDGRLNLDDVKEMNFDPDEQRIFSLQPDDVLVTEGSGSLRSVGASAVWKAEIPGTVCFQNTLLRIRPKNDQTDARFLAWWSRAAFTCGRYASIATGANIFHISAERVRALPIHCPPLDRQREITDYLDTEIARIDVVVAKKRQMIDLLLVQDIADIDNEMNILSERFGRIPLRRHVRSVEQGWSPQCENTPANGDEWGVLKVSSVKNGEFSETENKRLPVGLKRDLRYQVRPGDLLVTRANTPSLVGSAAVVPRIGINLLLCDKIFRIHPSDDLDKSFFVYLSRSSRIRDLCASASHGTSQSMANLKTADIKEWPVPAAPLSVQRESAERIMRKLARSNSLRTLHGKQMSSLLEYRKALITAAVSDEMEATRRAG